MLLIDASLRPSPISGLGCFTNEPIRRGDIVWIFDERIDVRLPVDELAALPKATQAFFHKYGYVEVLDGRRTVTLCGDHAKHMNHSDAPNLVNSDDGLDGNIAARDIRAGEELTCDYYSFDLDAERKLSPQHVELT
jgi:hypothetical protein